MLWHNMQRKKKHDNECMKIAFLYFLQDNSCFAYTCKNIDTYIFKKRGFLCLPCLLICFSLILPRRNFSIDYCTVDKLKTSFIDCKQKWKRGYLWEKHRNIIITILSQYKEEKNFKKNHSKRIRFSKETVWLYQIII